MKKILALVICTALSGLCLAANSPGFKVTKQYPVPGNGGFDYIVFDSSSDRLYVSHGTEVNVLDASSGKVLGKIENTPGVHGIAIVPDLHRGFITDGKNASVTVFDTKTLKTRKTIAVGQERFRTLVAPAVADDPVVQFAVLRPQSLIDAANSSSRDKLRSMS